MEKQILEKKFKIFKKLEEDLDHIDYMDQPEEDISYEEEFTAENVFNFHGRLSSGSPTNVGKIDQNYEHVLDDV